MFWIQETATAIRDFMELGGDVLVAIAVLTLLMWIAILERVIFLNYGVKRQVEETAVTWHDWPQHKSWQGKQVRNLLLAEIDWNSSVGIQLIKTMVALCPLLGLLGTVTGMISVFDVMAVSGTGNARSMAAGVSKATVPTMAGMVAALSGVFAVTYLERKARKVVLDADEVLIEQD